MGRQSISADFDDVRAGKIHFGDNYYGAGDRPPGLHVGVPPMPSPFIGREPLIAEVARRLVDGSSLALSADGLPGVGKTTLAVALAYRREVLDHFTDGVLWGALGLQPNVMEVLASWAAALGIGDSEISQATDPRTRATLVRNAIGQQRLVLVIDDAWDAESAMVLRCGGPNCAHFLTTRNESIARAFAGSQGKVEIRELEPDDALRLLTELAPEACNADPEAAARLVQAVGYLPLAIELMGAYLSEAENRYFRERQEAALQRIADPAERLRQACKRLGDSHGTEVTLRETIRLSLQGLPDNAVAAFHALGAFAPKPETFDARAAVAVTETDLATLSRLIERHLLEKEKDGPLSMHQTIADVARDEISEGAVQSHATHYLQRVTEAGDDWRAVEAIYAQVKWSFERVNDDPARVLEFTDVLSSYQSIRGLRDDGLRWNELEIQAAQGAGDRRREAVALNDRGWLHNSLGELDRALQLFQQALAIQRAIGYRQGEAVTLNNIGSLYFSQGEYDRALEFYQQALPITRAVDNQGGEAEILTNIGAVYTSLGDGDRALEFFEQALPIRRAVGDRAGEAVTLNNIGSVYDSLDDRGRALEFYQEGLSIRREIGDCAGEAVTRFNIAMTHRDEGNLEEAIAELRQVVELDAAVKHPDLESDRRVLAEVEAQLAERQRGETRDP